MADSIDGVRAYYGATGLVDRLEAALAVFGPADQALSPRQLATLDQFHTRGLAATLELAELAGIGTGTKVLDVGAGIGGPARMLAASRGCHVTGIDLSESFVAAASYLASRTGQQAEVAFQVGSALDLPVDDGRFDTVLLQHVAMNIRDRSRLYREIRRVLKPGGRFATYDVVSNEGDLHYPVPWAPTADTSFLLSAASTRAAIEPAGFRALTWRDDTEMAKAWVDAMRASGPPPSPNLGVVMGADFKQSVFNLGRNLLEGRIGILTAVFEAVATHS